MITFRLNGRPHRVPAAWSELTAAQLLAAAPHLAHDSVSARHLVLRAWCPKLRDKDVRRLTSDQLWDVLSLVGWAWKEQLVTDCVREFTHRGRTYRLPEAQLTDGVAIEYAMATLFFHQFANPRQPRAAALDQLVATLCRPVRAELAALQENPEWDGQAREKYNGKLAEGRAKELADAPLGVKIVVLHHFLAAQRFVHRAYPDLFKKAPEPAPEAGPAPAPRKVGTGTEMLELLAHVAEQGLYGTYEQVAHTALHTVLFNLAHQARHRRAAERENRS